MAEEMCHASDRGEHMFNERSIEFKEDVNHKIEVQLDGEDDLSAALSNSESDYPMV